MPSLRIKLPHAPGAITYALAGEKITLGRRPDNTIQIEDRSVSAHHAELVAVSGHYRLHDLGSTNRTYVDGQPVRDFHLHGPCKLVFGTVEAEYLPVCVPAEAEQAPEYVPTRAELDFLKRENQELRAQIVALQKHIDIMGSARLVTSESTQQIVAGEVHRRVLAERDQLRKEHAALQLEAEHARCDILALMRDRDAMQQAWKTVKAELDALRATTGAVVRPVPAPIPAETAGHAPVNITDLADRLRSHALNLKNALEALAADPADGGARHDALVNAEALATLSADVAGHPVQRLASAMDLFLSDLAQREDHFEAEALKPLLATAEIIPALLEESALERAKNLPRPRVLALDDDPDLLSTLIASLEMSDLKIVGRSTAAGALSELRGRAFDLIFLDIDMPDANGLDVCTEIRALPGYRLTPIVFLSGGDNPENRAQAARNGGSDFMAKPFNILELTLRAETWIFKHQFGLLK